MSIFRRDLTTASAPAAALPSAREGPAGARRGTVTVIVPGTKVKGEVTGTTEVQVEGEIEGDVNVEALVVVGAGGAVLGPVHGRVVRVNGQVAGTVTATERVEVGATGSVEGDIAAPRVVIAEGAFFRGKIDMKSDQGREPRHPTGASAEPPTTALAQAGEAIEAGSE
jgi:cytoskeletal protein CcmA (bactofilin family)